MFQPFLEFLNGNIVRIFFIVIVVFYIEVRHASYGNIDERIKDKLSFLFFLRCFKYSLAISFLLIIVNRTLQVFNVELIEKIINGVNVQMFKISDLGYYILSFSILIFIAFTIFNKTISNNLWGIYQADLRNSILTFFFYLSLNLFTILIFFIFYNISSILINYLDYLLISGNFSPLNYRQEQAQYKNGIYISSIIGFTASLIFLNSSVKSKIGGAIYDIEEILTHILVFLLIGFVTFSAAYSIINFILNIILIGIEKGGWYDNDKLIGFFSIRITSMILFYNMMSFVFKKIYNNKISLFIKGFLPINFNTETQGLGRLSEVDTSREELIYFAQTGYYILNVLVIQFLISNNNIDIYSSAIFIIMPLIVDDFFIIYDYLKTHGVVLKFHFIKIHILNLGLLISSLLSLIKENHPVMLVLYIILTLIFCLIYIKNFSLRQVKSEKHFTG